MIDKFDVNVTIVVVVNVACICPDVSHVMCERVREHEGKCKKSQS